LVLPTTYASALLLLLLSFFCLGLWPSLFKRSGAQWRFELFYFDFAIGALLLSVIAAFTFGTFGSEMAFSDRMLVAGRSAQAWAGAAGFLFNLGNMLLVAAISLLGISAAFPLAIGLALIIESFYNFRADNIFLLVSGVVLFILAIVLDGTACRLRDFVMPKPQAKGAPKTVPPTPSKKKALRTTKGIILALLGGVALGLFYPVFTKGTAGDFGLGPYAGVLLFSIGMMLSTIVFNFYFMNIAIEGGAIQLNAYFRGKPRQHFLGFAAGAMWATGALAATLAATAPSDIAISTQLRILLPLASAILAVFSGLLLWKEFGGATPNARVSIGLAAVFFSAALVLAGLGLAR
jgi:glucose uptake protein